MRETTCYGSESAASKVRGRDEADEASGVITLRLRDYFIWVHFVLDLIDLADIRVALSVGPAARLLEK